MKLSEIYKKYLIKFKENNIEEISLRILLCYFFNFKDMSEFYIEQDKDFNLTNENLSSINRVLNGEPVYYVINECEFYNFKFYVDKRVLIPRIESEFVLKKCIDKITDKFKSNEELKICDLGTGSGCIAIVLDKLLNYKKEIFAVDNSKKALEVCKINKNKFNSNINLVKSDMIKFLNNNSNFNVLYANPPYISKKYEVDKSVLNYEPKNALFISPSYYYYEKIIENRGLFLNKKYIMVFEIGYDQKNILEGFLKNVLDFKKEKYEFYKDLDNRDRILVVESL